jgi:cyanophycin synthetase
MIARFMGAAGNVVGFAGRKGRFVGNRQIAERDNRGVEGPRALLLNPRVEAAVFELDREDVLRNGLGFDRCDVAVVLDESACASGGRSPERTLLDNARIAVVPAQGPLEVELAARAPDSLILFGGDVKPLRHQSPAAPCRGVFLRGSLVHFEHAAAEEAVVFSEMQSPHLPAVAAVWALGLDPATIAKLLACGN